MSDRHDIYIRLIFDLLPLAEVGGLCALILHLREAMRMRTSIRIIRELVLSFAVGACAAFTMGCALPLIPWVGGDPSLELLAASVGGALGRQGVNYLSYKLFGERLDRAYEYVNTPSTRCSYCDKCKDVAPESEPDPDEPDKTAVADVNNRAEARHDNS